MRETSYPPRLAPINPDKIQISDVSRGIRYD